MIKCTGFSKLQRNTKNNTWIVRHLAQMGENVKGLHKAERNALKCFNMK